MLRSNGDRWPETTSALLQGGGEVLPRRRMGGLYMLPGEEGEPFRRMREHPVRQPLHSIPCQLAHSCKNEFSGFGRLATADEGVLWSGGVAAAGLDAGRRLAGGSGADARPAHAVRNHTIPVLSTHIPS